MRCPQCGEEVTEGAVFCWACEAPLDNLRLPPASARAARSDAPKAPPKAGKWLEILGFAVFMFGVLWSCGATAASKAGAGYAGPITLMAIGVLLYASSKFQGRRHAKK